MGGTLLRDVAHPAPVAASARKTTEGPLSKLDPVLIVPDAHAPYHDQRAWRLMLRVGKAIRTKVIVCIGDLADFYSVSSHEKSPDRANRFEWEIGEANAALDDLDALGATEKHFIAGNHENRLDRYLMTAPELFGVVSVPKLMNLRERGWTYTPYKRDKKIGKIHYTHDVGTAGRYSVFKALGLYQHSNVTGHSHRMVYVVENNALGDCPKVSASFGWLGDVNQIDYMHMATARSAWPLGFGVGYLDPKTGYTYLVPVPILDYTCCVNGKLFTG